MVTFWVTKQTTRHFWWECEDDEDFENYDNPLRALEALALYLLDHSMWPLTKEA